MTREIAAKLANSDDPAVREFALHNFPDAKGDVTEWFKTLDDAFKALGVDKPDYMQKLKARGLKPYQEAEEILTEIVIPAANQGWKADPHDHNQRKWFPIWNLSGGSSGSRFSLHDHDRWFSRSRVGVRFAYKDAPTLRHVCQLPEVEALYKTSVEQQ